MRIFIIKVCSIAIILSITCIFWAQAQFFKQPETFIVDMAVLQASKKNILNGDEALKEALDNLVAEADESLLHRPYSVVYKSKIPPSGSKHDYMSVGPYWWPDTTKANGLPYIRRDGEENPERHTIKDADYLKALAHDVKLLGLTFYFTEDEKYAQHAASLLKTWFLNKETKMNPNLNFGQAIPGITEGRGIGLIDTKPLVDVVDGVQLIKNSKAWTSSDHKELLKWFKEFMTWMMTSTLGKDELDEHNNHGTYYDLQVVSFALFTNQKELARKIIMEQTIPRIAEQIKQDGSQPHELARTKSWGYASMNLKGFFGLARLSEHLEIDLWNYETSDHKSIKKAFEWMLPYVKEELQWTYQQIEPIQWKSFLPLIIIAEPHYPNLDLTPVINKLKTENSNSVLFITHSVFY
ncbi:alginate lyase family protein [Chryseosolibacter indicus]|uniref:Alginate lyase family protein n=1 Tax=Chryseosolibacter indicus TaxID=2782351 RepID=A0ABS5VQP7_9BACT|nr:alginate lyase family protein [Chryseosolibacter indicus]MBT1703770.1 alginate lyase family protein [Chryseosolibacter indicus]